MGKCNFYKKLAKKALPRYNLIKHKEDKVLKGRLFRLKISQIVLVCTVGILAWLIYGFSTASAETALVSLNVASGVLEMSLSTSKVSISLAPVNNTPAFNSGNITVTVGTNNDPGYTLLMAAENYDPKIPRSAALSDNTTPTIDPIPYVSGGYTESTFRSSSDTTNKWGYKSSSSNYKPLSAADVPIYWADAGSNGESQTITFAAKVDNTQPAGTYSTGITFTALANPHWYYLQDVDLWEDMVAVGETVESLDLRTGFIYEVTKLTNNGVNYLWMKNNLKLPAGTVLTSGDSDVSSNFTLPTEEWTSSSQNYYCKAIMATAGGEYYYNWYAAKANPYVCTNPTANTNASSTNDNKSLGSICPKGWTLPTYDDITYTTLWNSGANPGGLSSTGSFYSGAADGVGTMWVAWSSDRSSNAAAYEADSYHGGRGTANKSEGYPIRCVRSQQNNNNLVFKVGDGIDTIIVVNKSNLTAVYATHTIGPAVITLPNSGTTELIVTVVPRQGYILDSWSGDTSGLASSTLLTTTYTTSTSTGGILTANGTSGHYDYIQSSSTACSNTGTNVTDSRDGKSYTVANLGYCYMLSNLRLDQGITLTSSDSDITPNSTYQYFTTPTEEWTNSNQNYYCKAMMAVKNHEYYYNWYAANANPYVCSSPTASTNATETNDAKSLGSVCPKGWHLLNIEDQYLIEDLWAGNSVHNYGLLYTSGNFYSGSQSQVGTYGYWQSNKRYSNSDSFGLVIGDGVGTIGASVDAHGAKYLGIPVRCYKDGS